MVPDNNAIDEMAGLAYLMLQEMEEKPQLLSSSVGKAYIFRVPQKIVKINEDAYYPSVVSIGPYHYGKEHLQMLQEHKWKFLRSLLDRCEPHGIHLQQLIDAVSPDEERIRECYSECINKFGTSQLVMMMVLDGCFIIELLAMWGHFVELDDIWGIQYIISGVVFDLCKLENQIPYFVVERLFEVTRASLPVEITLVEFALHFLNAWQGRPSHVMTFYINRIKDHTATVRHLLDLYLKSFMPPDGYYSNYTERDHPHCPKAELIQSAQMLRQAGIKFRRKEPTSSFLEISFNNGILEIPFFRLDDYTHTLLLNFVAFEQCYRPCPQHITSYIMFMRCLINSAADSEYLESKQIIEKYLGTHETVTHVFNHICRYAGFDINSSYLFTVFVDVHKYSSNPWRAGWGGIKEKYFSAPWAWMAALGALFGLLLTAAQTVFSVLGSLNPPNQ